jgi:hypothetical protein
LYYVNIHIHVRKYVKYVNIYTARFELNLLIYERSHHVNNIKPQQSPEQPGCLM